MIPGVEKVAMELCFAMKESRLTHLATALCTGPHKTDVYLCKDTQTICVWGWGLTNIPNAPFKHLSMQNVYARITAHSTKNMVHQLDMNIMTLPTQKLLLHEAYDDQS
jgi:hypothetical protein